MTVNEALEAALMTFWRNGYERTSITDLTTATGASRYGLYDEFGDKETLYNASLDFYRDQLVTGLLGSLETKSNADLTDLNAYFRRLLETCDSELGSLGCFMSLSAVDLASENPDIAKRVQANFDRVRRCFETALENAQASGQWAPERNPKSTAAALLGIIQGAAVFQRAGEPNRQIKSYLKNSVDMLI